jgi:ABC-type multidrug transport system ATPase subunit
VAAQETFGLLGPNGAGKTTLISMLTGMTNPDHGNAWIGGFDIGEDIGKAQLQMGVCPQFDLLWPQLTVQEHLTFYARLKGVTGDNLGQRVKEAIEEVNLTNFSSFLASSLSGGMKRRLSIAVSLVGDPQIVFLDEPSTGLDPDNRRQIWEVLVRCQERRALFLTTHMMEEADALCHRIGIITHGALRTVGNQLRLKKDYGQGYRLSFSLSARREKTLVSAEALHINLSENNNLDGDREQ